MHFLFLLAYATLASAGHCRHGGRPKSSLNQVSSSASSTSTSQAVIPTTSSSTTLLTTTSKAAVAPSSNPKLGPSGGSSTSSGGDLKASFTNYGGCKSKSVACGFFGGFNAAVSQNLFGAAPGAGAGPACGTCYSLSSSTAGTKPIVVKVNNLCPAEGNAAMCAQSGMSGTNSIGANVNFDLCADDGSAAQFFGSSGLGMTTGTATLVECN